MDPRAELTRLRREARYARVHRALGHRARLPQRDLDDLDRYARNALDKLDRATRDPETLEPTVEHQQLPSIPTQTLADVRRRLRRLRRQELSAARDCAQRMRADGWPEDHVSRIARVDAYEGQVRRVRPQRQRGAGRPRAATTRSPARAGATRSGDSGDDGPPGEPPPACRSARQRATHRDLTRPAAIIGAVR